VGVVTLEAFLLDEGQVSGDGAFHLEQFRMAFGTGFIGRRPQEILVLGAVGIVAGAAESVDHRFVGVGSKELDLGVGVARIADHVHPVREDGCCIGPVGVVAGAAVVLHERIMAHRLIP